MSPPYCSHEGNYMPTKRHTVECSCQLLNQIITACSIQQIQRLTKVLVTNENPRVTKQNNILISRKLTMFVYGARLIYCVDSLKTDSSTNIDCNYLQSMGQKLIKTMLHHLIRITLFQELRANSGTSIVKILKQELCRFYNN